MTTIRPVSRFLPLLVIAAVALVATGCSKKTTPPDVTQTTPAPDAGNNGGNNDANATPVDKVPGDDADNANLKDIYFDYDDHTLSADARSTLSGNASYLREMGAIRVNIEGHCDERGTVEYNLALGQRRADATRSYLVDLGIESSRLSTISYGEERPFEMGHDESAWHQNRRAHFRVVNP